MMQLQFNFIMSIIGISLYEIGTIDENGFVDGTFFVKKCPH